MTMAKRTRRIFQSNCKKMHVIAALLQQHEQGTIDTRDCRLAFNLMSSSKHVLHIFMQLHFLKLSMSAELAVLKHMFRYVFDQSRSAATLRLEISSCVSGDALMSVGIAPTSDFPGL